MKNQIWKKAGTVILLLTGSLTISTQEAAAGGAWTFSSSTTAADTQTFATITSVKHDVGLDGNGGVEVITIAGTNSSGSAIRASITLPTALPATALLATMESAEMNAARSCEKQAILFKTGLSGSTSFVMRSYTSSGSCSSDACYNLSSPNTVISCSLE